jgi:hypothetical protein
VTLLQVTVTLAMDFKSVLRGESFSTGDAGVTIQTSDVDLHIVAVVVQRVVVFVLVLFLQSTCC